MTIVNGNPAMSYQHLAKDVLMYVRATDVSGSSWGTPILLDDTGWYSSLVVVDGNPAICYFATNSDLKYIQAEDTDGVSWSVPITVESAGNVGTHSSMTIVNGGPAISYYDTSAFTAHLKYAWHN